MSISVRLFPRLDKAKSSETNPVCVIYCRLKVNGIAATDFSTKITCKLNDWNKSEKKIKGRSAVVVQDNISLERIISDLKAIYNDTIAKGKPCTADFVRNYYVSRNKKGEITLLIAYNEYIMDVKSKETSQGTLRTWHTRLHGLAAYLKHLGKNDIALDLVSETFAEQYLMFLKNTSEDSHIAKHNFALKAVMKYAVKKGYCNQSYIGHITHKKSPSKPRNYLIESQIKQIDDCPFFDNRLQKVADFFLIQCFTGMTYADLSKFDKEKHYKPSPKRDFIVIQRTKSGVFAQIPLLKSAKALFEKYDWKPPVISLDKTNLYMIEVAKIAEIDMHITTYTARYTAAMYLLNNAKLPMHYVSAILGHTSVLTTQKFYAKLTRGSIADAIGDEF